MPLSSYRVLDLTSGGASLAGQTLADLGADVVLIEPPGGVPERHEGPFFKDRPDPNASVGFWALHRNKRSISLDLDESAGRESLRRLAESADVVIESMPPGWLDERRLGYAELSEINPRLSVISITPFGESGPKAHWAATDLTLTAASGVMIQTGDEDRPPLTCSVPQAFLNAGADAAVAAMLALSERWNSGRGQHASVSVQTSMMMTTQSFVLAHAWGDQQLERFGGGARAGPIRFRLVYPCKDGYVNFTFLFGPALGPFTARMFQWMYEEGFVDEATRDKDWVGFGAAILTGGEPLSELERCAGVIERFTRAHTKAELYRAAFERRVLIVPLSDAADLLQSSQLRERGFWVPVRHEELGVTVDYPGPCVKLSRTPIQVRRRPPLLGEHQQEVLEEDRPPAPPPQTAGALERRPPLAGLRVLDFTWVYAGPAITKMLADYGASVIRLETGKKLDALRTGGPYKDRVPDIERSAGYANLNVGKLGLGLDLSVPAARELVLRLVEWADIVVENFTPKAMRAWQLDYEHLRRVKPELIMLSSCLNGQDGHEAMLAGFGTMGASLAGFGHLTGWQDRAPCGPFGAYSDYVSPRFATCAVLAALEHRRRTGEGQYIDCSQVEASIQMIGSAMLDYQVNERVPRAEGNGHRSYAPSGVYPVRGEDRWVAIAAPQAENWAELCKLSGRGWESDVRFATPDARLRHRAELDEAIATWTRDQEVADLEEELQAVHVAVHRVSRNADHFEDPQLRALEHFVWLDHPLLGSVPVEASRIRLSETPARYGGPGPTIGQHNQEILSEILGLSGTEISDLAVSGALE